MNPFLLSMLPTEARALVAQKEDTGAEVARQLQMSSALAELNRQKSDQNSLALQQQNIAQEEIDARGQTWSNSDIWSAPKFIQDQFYKDQNRYGKQGGLPLFAGMMNNTITHIGKDVVNGSGTRGRRFARALPTGSQVQAEIAPLVATDPRAPSPSWIQEQVRVFQNDPEALKRVLESRMTPEQKAAKGLGLLQEKEDWKNQSYKTEEARNYQNKEEAEDRTYREQQAAIQNARMQQSDQYQGKVSFLKDIDRENRKNQREIDQMVSRNDLRTNPTSGLPEMKVKGWVEIKDPMTGQSQMKETEVWEPANPEKIQMLIRKGYLPQGADEEIEKRAQAALIRPAKELNAALLAAMLSGGSAIRPQTPWSMPEISPSSLSNSLSFPALNVFR